MDFTLSIRLPAETVEKIINIAKAQQLSPEAIVRRSINYYELISSGSHKLVEKDGLD